MTLQLSQELEQRLSSLAAAREKPSGELAAEILSDYLQHVDQLARELDEAEEEAERTGWLTTEEVFARLYAKLPKPA